MIWRAIEEWFILTLIGTFAVAFIWYTRGETQYDLVFIWPLVILIGILLVAVAIQVGLGSAVADTTKPPSEPPTPGATRKRLGFGILMFLLLVGLSILGFFTSLSVFLVASMWVLGVRNWLTLVLVPIGLMSLLYICFVKLLEVPLSPSLLGFY